jgi:hypothetical protein
MHLPQSRGPAESATAELMRVVSGHDPVKLNGALVDAIGAPTASIVQLFDLAIGHDAPIVRSEAVRALVGLLETDQRVQAALMKQLHFMDDVQVASLLRSREGTHAGEFLLNVLEQAPSVELRTRAATVL